MKSFKGMKKWLLAGALTLAVSVPVGAASAATPGTTTVQYRVYYVNQGNTSWNAWLQQYLQQYYSGQKQPAQVQKPVVQQPVQKSVQPQPTPQQPAQPKPATPTAPADSGQATETSTFASQVVNLVNQERAKAGLSKLTSNAALANMALVKAKDMKNNNYFSHNSPTYGSPFDMMKQFGISYRYAGENIAMGQRTPAEVMQAWMNSPGHKENILNKNFTQIGVAYYQGEWVQEFIG